MKKTIILFIAVFLSPLLKAQTNDYDTVALVILDRMSSVIGDLSSCSYTLNISTDNADTGFINTHYTSNAVSMTGPDKMYVDVHGDRGHRVYYYNGSAITYYSFDENNYATVAAPPNIVDAMDSIHAAYDVDFPAADFFYPTFTDDILDNFDEIDYTGLAMVDGVECFHILAKGKDRSVQLWITNDATTLPKKFVITYNTDKLLKRYEATFFDWKLNPDIPASVYEFPMPPNAHEVTLMPINGN